MLGRRLEGFPFNEKSGRYTCTPTKPMPANAEGRWEHTSVREQDRDSDYGIYYECKDCEAKWFVEIDG